LRAKKLQCDGGFKRLRINKNGQALTEGAVTNLVVIL
jgi:hypothetical protein